MKKIFILWTILSLLLSSCSNNEKSAFQKKQECLKYKEKIEKKLQEEVSWVSKLDIIFYSSEKDSCLYSYIYSWKNGNNYAYIIDYLTNEKIKIFDLNDQDNKKDFENKVKELK